ncbi:MAG: menaquinone biosynthetic enzyme MqnA/MqnD family protein [Daejeonella sp.]
MNKIKISAVSYTNTKPFVYGLMHSGISDQIDLSLDIPSECASKLINDQADIGLVPVAALTEIPNYKIISNYCIGASGSVDSVFIFSDIPIQKVRSLKLDSQSRTSNDLAKVLLKNHWRVQPELVTDDPADAFVEIGDRTFGKKGQYVYQYDLAEEWRKFTGLPFVFAVWASNKEIPESFIAGFNSALKYGLEHRREIIESIPQLHDFDINDYLLNKIDYILNEQKIQALGKFQEFVRLL